jgi:hypothetical protein
MRKLCLVTVVAALVLILGQSVYAATATQTASVSATVTSTCTLSLARDAGSATRGTVSSILFDKTDAVDMPADPNRSATMMYAPYRSETGKNWHFANVSANGASIQLKITATGTLGAASLSNILKVWCGGFYSSTGAPGVPITGTASTTWESIGTAGWQRSLTNQPFTGVVPFNYQLDITTVPGSATAYTGTLTYTLTST